MFKRISNVVIAVYDVEKAAKLYTETFGFGEARIIEQPKIGVKSAFLPIGDATIEFIEPFGPNQAPVKKSMDSRGEAIYMLELEVESIDAAIPVLKEKGVRLLGAEPEERAQGSMVFIHPQSANNVLIRVVQKRT